MSRKPRTKRAKIEVLGECGDVQFVDSLGIYIGSRMNEVLTYRSKKWRAETRLAPKLGFRFSLLGSDYEEWFDSAREAVDCVVEKYHFNNPKCPLEAFDLILLQPQLTKRFEQQVALAQKQRVENLFNHEIQSMSDLLDISPLEQPPRQPPTVQPSLIFEDPLSLAVYREEYLNCKKDILSDDVWDIISVHTEVVEDEDDIKWESCMHYEDSKEEDTKWEKTSVKTDNYSEQLALEEAALLDHRDEMWDTEEMETEEQKMEMEKWESSSLSPPSCIRAEPTVLPWDDQELNEQIMEVLEELEEYIY